MVWKETFFAKQKSNFLSYNILLRQIFFLEHKSSHHFSVLYHHYLAHWKVSLFSIYLFIYFKCVCVCVCLCVSLKEFLHVSKTYIFCYLWTFQNNLYFNNNSEAALRYSIILRSFSFSLVFSFLFLSFRFFIYFFVGSQNKLPSSSQEMFLLFFSFLFGRHSIYIYKLIYNMSCCCSKS